MNQLYSQQKPGIGSEIQYLITAAQRFSPSLKGVTGVHQPGMIKHGEDNNEAIALLYQRLQTAHPEAGMPYWSIRAWSLLAWQPIYLALIGVHQLNIVAPIDKISQIRTADSVAGFVIPSDSYIRSDVNDLISVSACQLKHVCNAIFDQLSEITRIRKVSAMRLIADTLLAALNRLKHSNSQLTNQHIINLGELWLSAMELSGQSSYMPIKLSSGREQLVLNRKGCCMHYRRQDGALCASCPKQQLPLRIERCRKQFNS